MRRSVRTILFAAAAPLLLSSCAWYKASGLEAEPVLETGGAVHNNSVGGVTVAGRVRYLKGLNIGAEGYAFLPNGVGANALIDVWRDKHLRLHVGDPGVYRVWNTKKWHVHPEIHRKMDLTLGAGAEVRLQKHWSLALDYRVFMPDPFTTDPYYGEFANRAYWDAVKGGQLWFGFAYAP